MRQIIPIFFLFFFLVSCGQETKPFARVSYTVDFQYMENCETGKGVCGPIKLIRHTIKDTIVVMYPDGGTTSAVYLYPADSTFTKWLNAGPKYQPLPICQDAKRHGQGNPVLDLTGLPDGKYISHMLSCGVGGFLKLDLITED